MWELPCLVSVHCLLGIVHSYENIAIICLYLQVCVFINPLCLMMREDFGGTNSLSLIVHVALLYFLRFWEVLVQIIPGYQWLG